MSPIPVLFTLLCLGQMPEKEVSLKAMQQRVQGSRVKLSNDAKSPLQLVAAPVFRYSDELRHIEDAGIWLWTERGRPAAAMKVEYYQPGVHPRPWLYCFASLSSELVAAEWEDNPTFQARKPGVIWKTLDDTPATTRPARLVQMRDIARRFAAELQEPNLNKDVHQMRLLTRPLYRYDDGLADAVDGAVFGFTGTGTNPDLLLLLELSKEGGWQFGVAGMTAAGVTVRLKDNVVWQISDAAGKGRVFDTWTYFLPAK
ncbi:MAG: hypothetical protein AABP62_02300 [Planctomycetota bacterium]